MSDIAKELLQSIAKVNDLMAEAAKQGLAIRIIQHEQMIDGRRVLTLKPEIALTLDSLES